MAYTPTNWEESTTSLGPTNLNHMEQGIKEAHDMLEPATLVQAIFNYYHPVGCYFETTDTNFNPNTAWGGTWELERPGLVHVSAGVGYPVSANAQDGGSKTVTLTAAQSGNQAQTVTSGGMSANASHSHTYEYVGDAGKAMAGDNPSGKGAFMRRKDPTEKTGLSTASASVAHTHSVTIAAKNAAEAHDNMMPHKNVNRWHRTA